MNHDFQDESKPRRAFLADMAKLAAAGVVAGWTPIYQVAANAATAGATPPGFPADIPLYKQAFQNWSGEIVVQDVWTAAPRSADDVVATVNWARANGYRVRPRGYMHNWSPLTLEPGAAPANIVLLDTTKSLTAVSVDTSTRPARVTAQTGVSLETLLAKLEDYGLGVVAAPAPGDITLGGALAIDAHGTAVPAVGEALQPGHTYGSLSNLVIALTAVVFDPASRQYALRTFQRNDPDIGAFLAHIGRALVVEVTLAAGPNQRLRCQSFIDIPASELFSANAAQGRTVASFLDQSGRLEAIWFPFTTCPWLKVWSLKPSKPLLSRPVTQPYNYPFSDSIPQSLSDLVKRIIIGGEGALTPLFGQTQYAITTAGLALTLSADIWGWSRTVLQYIRPTTLRVTANGYAVLARRADVQRVVSEFVQYYQNRVDAYKARGEYPMNGPVEIRITGLDKPAEAGAGAVVPTLSALKPRPDHPEWDVAVWFDILTLPGTPAADRFYREIEQWMLSNYSGAYATVRPEWSKGWAYTDTAAWQDDTMLATTIPNLQSAGQPAASNWEAARATLERYDPQRIFRSPLLDRLMP
ncbi:cholesterol oxidase substrate-binding domain-containing protein [Burkholderia ubonensis]|uniref:FAD-linked oxidase n=1 Tax=Burkholderia ubonensis subsp. mesacidophila TaxID=265293 RepID=A0A2A4FBI6_9BURK|nr:cholesterol oxidase substrate-binding domain-containing protein [Burkholderia ubonensis]PCE29944.1 FAD-linked oxidase [Burkholderia ubonensis subsp. mesacidophila]